MKSLKWKLITMYLGLVLLVMIVSGTYILLSLRNIEISKSRQELVSYAEKINDQVIAGGEEEYFQSELFKTVSNSIGIQGNILDAKGKTIASTTDLQPPYEDYKSSVIIAAMAGVSSFSTGKKNTDSFWLAKEWMSYATPVKNANDEIVYIIFTRLDATDMKNSLRQTTQTIIIAVMLALLLAAIMGFVFSQTLTGPILELTKGAKNLAEGSLNQKIKVRSDDEIGQLTASFNNMATKLEKNMADMSKEKNKLEIILHNMTDGVLSFDKEGELIHVNTASMEMLEVDELHLTFSQFIKKFDINSGVYLDMGPEVSQKVNFPVGNRFINASFSPYSSETEKIAGVVVVLQDITEQKKLDDMRKEFVANVSHELRTPLTTIKSYTETLLDGALEDKEIATEFLDIVNSEADRMAFLVRDLLQLSRFDSKQVQLDITEIPLNAFLEETVRQNKIHAEAKDQKLYYIPLKRDIILYGDRDRISQVINNIVTNAIKYSLSKAEIRISTGEDAYYYKIIVKDTGMGIQREDLPRIFERFYRVDKARSRAMGGTGLGLAIAKEIMESHGGRLTAESEYGKGTTMTMWFPKAQQEPWEGDLLS